ncbi:MAG: hypothetical protein PHS02_04235 [Candidatus ainarchaeum sp.]|nr:hypothetical protein [Candidatus ainarchaeum sp.]
MRALLISVFLILFLAGCTFLNPPGQNTTLQPNITINITQNQSLSPQQPFSAKDGLQAAETNILWFRNDSKLVSVKGSSEGAGLAPQWDYYFDSLSGSKGYALTVPDPDASIRDMPFSFLAPLNGLWIDSPAAASACGMDSAEFSLEVEDGIPVWTLISGSDVCRLNALNGALLG